MSAKSFLTITILLIISLPSVCQKLTDTVYNPRRDTVIIRIFRNKKLKTERYFTNKQLQYKRQYIYSKKWYGYLTKYVESNKHNLAPFKNFWNNGSLRMIGSTRDNKLEGAFYTFYPNGKPQCNCNYVKGKRDGVQIFHYDNGRQGYEKIYKNGVPWSIEQSFNKEGAPENVGTLKNGAGTFFIYDKNDILKKIEHYQSGTLMKTERVKK